MKAMTLAAADRSEKRDGASDNTLVQRAVNGDRTAFALLVERHYGFIFRVAFRWSGDRMSAEETTQEVCVRLGKAIRKYKGASAFTTWLYSLTINAARDLARKAKRETVKAEAWGQHQEIFGDDGGSEDAERAMNLWRLVQKLPDKQRDAVLLVYGEGLSHSDAGEVMACAETTVSWHVHEAKKRLKQLVAKAEDE